MLVRNTFFRLVPALAVILAATVPSVRGAQLQLPNGDRLTGEILERSEGVIRFRSPILGEISVPEAGTTVIPAAPVADSQPTPESLAGLPPAPPEETPPAPAPAAAVAASAAAPDPAAPDAPKASVAAPRPPWKGSLELGFIQQSGRQEKVDFTIRATANRKIARDSYLANARLLYSEQSGRTSSNRYDGSFRWRRDLSAGIFGQAITSYMTDSLKRIEHNIEQNVGLGYRILDRRSHVVNVGLGATGQYRQDEGLGPETNLLGEVFEDYTYRVNERFTLTQDARFQLASPSRQRPIDGKTYKVRFNSALQGKVTDRVSINLRFEYEFDTSIANPDARTDQRITSSLGYAF